ncbi:hypothetical protein KM043_000516 [Ampulex compressa]|nr:hypothetical protein KM043_000516 [Ampulex compressa]
MASRPGRAGGGGPEGDTHPERDRGAKETFAKDRPSGRFLESAPHPPASSHRPAAERSRTRDPPVESVESVEPSRKDRGSKSPEWRGSATLRSQPETGLARETTSLAERFAISPVQGGRERRREGEEAGRKTSEEEPSGAGRSRRAFEGSRLRRSSGLEAQPEEGRGTSGEEARRRERDSRSGAGPAAFPSFRWPARGESVKGRGVEEKRGPSLGASRVGESARPRSWRTREIGSLFGSQPGPLGREAGERRSSGGGAGERSVGSTGLKVAARVSAAGRETKQAVVRPTPPIAGSDPITSSGRGAPLGGADSDGVTPGARASELAEAPRALSSDRPLEEAGGESAHPRRAAAANEPGSRKSDDGPRRPILGPISGEESKAAQLGAGRQTRRGKVERKGSRGAVAPGAGAPRAPCRRREAKPLAPLGPTDGAWGRLERWVGWWAEGGERRPLGARTPRSPGK